MLESLGKAERIADVDRSINWFVFYISADDEISDLWPIFRHPFNIERGGGVAKMFNSKGKIDNFSKESMFSSKN